MPDYGFRPVTRDDLPMLAGWLRDGRVAAWWEGPEHQLALVTEDLDNPAMTQLLVQADGVPIGYAQHCPAQAWPAPHLVGLPPDAVAIDVFSAPEGFGHGGAWLRALGDLLLRRVSVLAIDPDPGNARAIRAYGKAGFAGGAVLVDGEGQPVRLMTRLR